ncbi:MAG: hypothetical protein DLM58_08250 [Pseudonocardiales bacterium]|nr:MAG: hypothetical protein DLM58_08250 [Pseudonocardiales bacterium]
MSTAAANNSTQKGAWHRPAHRPLRREVAHLQRRGQLLATEDLVFLARYEGLTDDQIRGLIEDWESRPWPRR